jgi:hypothetical protein
MSLNSSYASPDLIQELSRCESQLTDWLAGSERNAQLFARDPIAAMRAANLDLAEDTLRELEQITNSIARKIKQAA